LKPAEEIIKSVTPAKAGVQKSMYFLDSGFCRNDGKRAFGTFEFCACFEFRICFAQ